MHAALRALAIVACALSAAAASADPKGYYYPPPPPMASASVAVANLATTGTDFVVRVNGTAYARGLAYGAFSAPITVPAGSVRVEIGTTVASVASTFELMNESEALLVAHGDGVARPYALLRLADDMVPAPALRLVHVAAHTDAATGLALRTDAGVALAGFESVASRSATTHVALAAGTMNLKVTNAAGTRTLVDLAPFALGAYDRVTLIVAGDGAAQALVATSTLTLGPMQTEAVVDLTYDGAFFEPTMPGQGFVFAVIPASDRLSGAWFTFGTQAGVHDWLLLDTGPAGFDGRVANAQLFRASGGRLADPSAAVSIAPVGTVRIEFAGCDGARLAITRTDVAFQREMTLTRLTPRAMCSVTSAP